MGVRKGYHLNQGYEELTTPEKTESSSLIKLGKMNVKKVY